MKDDGIGIAEADQAKLFLPFVRVGEPGHGRPPGTGLGLALTRQLVERQGGAVGVRSTPGVGSVFSVRLPCAPVVRAAVTR